MCLCTPEIRTPWCGKIGCQPKQASEVTEYHKEIAGAKHIFTLPPGEDFVDMMIHQDCVYLASTKTIYRIEGETVKPLQMVLDERPPG